MRLLAHFLQRAVPIRMIDVDRQHHNAMLLRVAHDLRRGIEPHRLRIEQSGRERRRVMAFQPARDIDQQRKAGSVAFGKAVFAEALDLVEAMLSELRIVAPLEHSPDHAFFELIDFASAAKSRHCLA